MVLRSICIYHRHIWQTVEVVVSYCQRCSKTQPATTSIFAHFIKFLILVKSNWVKLFTHFYIAEFLPKPITNSVFLPPHQFKHGKVFAQKNAEFQQTTEKNAIVVHQIWLAQWIMFLTPSTVSLPVVLYSEFCAALSHFTHSLIATEVLSEALQVTLHLVDITV